MTPAETAVLDQLVAEQVDIMLGVAARYDHLGEHEATSAMMRFLLDDGLNLIGATSAACTLALREHRRVKGGG